MNDEGDLYRCDYERRQRQTIKDLNRNIYYGKIALGGNGLTEHCILFHEDPSTFHSKLSIIKGDKMWGSLGSKALSEQFYEKWR
jgi:hypothetical protein